MADEIDIEEHDLLDNPQIKNIFPDLSILKQELQNYYDGASDINQETMAASCSRAQDSLTNSDTASGKQLDSLKVPNVVGVKRKIEYSENDRSTSKYVSKDNTSQLRINSNKIILGSKPNKIEYEKFFKKQLEPIESKILVGNVGPFSKRSKPGKQLEYEQFFEKQLETERPKVLLDDLGPYLKRSNRYCEVCLILFPNKNALDDHKTIHSSEGISQATVRRNKSTISFQCIKIKCNLCYTRFSTRGSLTRHYKNIHGKNIKNKIDDLRTTQRQKASKSKNLAPNRSNACFHCKISFPTQQSLVDHLYEVLQHKKLPCEKCSEEFSSKDKLKEHMIIHEKSKVSRKKQINELANLSPERDNNNLTSLPRLNVIHEKRRVLKKEESVPNIRDTKRSTPKRSLHKTNKKIKRNEESICIENQQTQKLATRKEKKNSRTQISSLYYRCYICSYYLKSSNFCLAHLVNKHKVTKISYTKVAGVPFNAKCEYCFLELSDVSAYNSHLQETHSQQYNFNALKKGQHEKEQPKVLQKPESKLTISSEHEKCEYNSFVLKSMLFKCIKCDIHFLSAKTAMNHIDHMEILINWKCSICQRIFKKHDELLHKEQHSFCHKFTVIDLSASALSRVLYKCPSCAVQFTEENFIKHYPVCGIKTPESVYCKVCDILIDNEISRSHEASHQYENLKFSDFTIVEADIIPNSIIQRKGRPTLKEQIKKAHDLKRKNVNNTSTSSSKKTEIDLDYMFNVTYCNTCKCFLTEKLKRNVHLAGRCSHLVKYVCKICGLVLTAKAYQTHKSLHRRMKNLKLQDFNFYSIESGEQIYPPLPEYPQCSNCDVYFLSKTHSLTHECSNEDYLTCHLCNLKFSEGTYKLHLLFHNYSNVNVNKETLKDNSSKLLDCTGKYITESDNSNQHTQSSDVLKTYGIRDNTLQKPKDDLPIAEFIFCCKNCSVAIDTYDEVIEHCQWHYSHECNQLCTEICQTCNVKFESSCYKNHQQRHSNLYEKQSFNILDFDIFYFTSKNDIWIKHVFGLVPQEKIDNIINKSIYKFECRIKMKVIQDGPPDCTVYKCDRCRCFIGGSSLYRHAENSCFKLRKHPCTFCGLPFISSISRMEHEEIHKGPSIGLKSYRIVIFNREEDKPFNNVLYRSSYILYQCRNCCGVVDKLQIKNHECNKNDLKKCSYCGVLLYREDFDTHCLRHIDLKNFAQNNMKIILFGEKINTAEADQEELVSSFNGTVYDYTFYSCTKCEVCVKTVNCSLKHSCAFGLSRIKCPNCDLYFATNRIKYHRKLHETDPDFVKDNINIIAFNAPDSNDSEVKLQNRLKEQILNDSCTEISTNLEKNPMVSSKTDGNDVEKDDAYKPVEAIAKLFKCTCGLHFLDQSTMSTHFKICNPRIRVSKQKCTKCDLLFTPNILFGHLLMHHGDRKHVYKFEIIETTKHKDFLYKCSKCNLHFVKETEVKEHFKTCNGTESDGRKCIDCNLLFEHSSLVLHESYEDVHGEYEIIVIEETLPKVSHGDASIGKKIIKPQSDILELTDSTVLSENKSLHSDLSNYSDTIYKCKECGIHFLTKQSIRLHLSEKHDVLAKLQDICNICGLNFLSSKLTKHIDIHHGKLKLKPTDLVITDSIEDI